MRRGGTEVRERREMEKRKRDEKEEKRRNKLGLLFGVYLVKFSVAEG